MLINSVLNWVQKRYFHTEHEYATLLDIQIRNAFQKVKLGDLKNPTGFTNLKDASQELKNFFACRKIFEQFIHDDITESAQQKAQLRAFKKWMNIAEILLEKHNYEAYCMVVYRLSQIDMDFKLSDELSSKNKQRFKVLETFASPASNFTALRAHMKSNLDPRKFSPTFLLSKDLTSLNEVLGKNTQSSKKDETLLQVTTQRKQEIPTLTKHLENTFKHLTERYQSEVAIQEPQHQPIIKPDSKKPAPKSADKFPKARAPTPKSEWQTYTPVSSIYNQKISPSFWNRCLKDHYCKKRLTAEEFLTQHRP